MTQFGTEFCGSMVTMRFEDGHWLPFEVVALGDLQLHPASHVLHYSSSCFEGFKAYQLLSGDVGIFRLRDHCERLVRSAKNLYLPTPDVDVLAEAVKTLVRHHVDEVPVKPGSLYIRPTLIGTTQNIGAAAVGSEDALLFVIASPVGEYFVSSRPLKLLVEKDNQRTSPHLGSTKTGGNYASALKPTLEAKAAHGVDQVLFCPNGDVQETGAANFILVDDSTLITKALDDSFLPGVTRDSTLKIAKAMGYTVEERDFTVKEMLDCAGEFEAILTGTAAGLSSVGSVIVDGTEITFRDGTFGPNVKRLQAQLTGIQYGELLDVERWITEL